MNAELIGRYLTASGKVGIAIKALHFGDHTVYSYNGAWGAGSTTRKDEVELAVNGMLRRHPRHSVDLNLWSTP